MYSITKFSRTVLLASASTTILSGGVAAQEILINQSLSSSPVVAPGSDEIDLVNGNTATAITGTGFGSVSLQSFQNALNTLNQGFATRTANAAPGLISQTIGDDLEIDADSINTIAAFSAAGPQTARGSQLVNTRLNSAGAILGDATTLTVVQNFNETDAGIDVLQNNILSAGYNPGSGGAFAVGSGPATLQGQALTPNLSGGGSSVVNTGFQTNAFNANGLGFAVTGSARAAVAQKAGNLDAELFNFADAGSASSTGTANASIDGIGQSLVANLNRIDSLGASETASTLVLDASGGNGFQQVGVVTGEPQTFSVRNTLRALTWNDGAQTPVSPATAVTWQSGVNDGAGDVAIRDSSQSLALGFNSVVAASPTQNIVLGGANAFAQTANYNVADGISISTAIDPPVSPDPPISEGYVSHSG